jgi:hypothetical protein
VSAAMGTREAADRAGITYRQIDYWIRRGYIATAGSVIVRKEGEIPVKYLNRYADQRGSGTQTRIDDTELQVLLLMARMSRARFATVEAARLARLSVTGNRSVLPLTAGTGLVLLVGPR